MDDDEYNTEYHRMMHPLQPWDTGEGRGCGCRCALCYDRDAVPRCICPECIALDHPSF